VNHVVDSTQFSSGRFPAVDALGSGTADSWLRLVAIRRRLWVSALVLLGPIGLLVFVLLACFAVDGPPGFLPVSRDSIARQQRDRRRSIVAIVTLMAAAGAGVVAAYRAGTGVEELTWLAFGCFALAYVLLIRHLLFQHPRASIVRGGAIRLSGVSPAFVDACMEATSAAPQRRKTAAL